MQPRHRHPWSRSTQEGIFPDGHKQCLVVGFLLDLMQRHLTFLRITLRELLGVPGVDLGIAEKRRRALTVHERLNPRGSIPERAAALPRPGSSPSSLFAQFAWPHAPEDVLRNLSAIERLPAVQAALSDPCVHMPPVLSAQTSHVRGLSSGRQAAAVHSSTSTERKAYEL